MAEEYSHVLYDSHSVVPIICERKSWKTCPEHKHLTTERPEIKDSVVTGIPFETFVDDPNDDIISITEYGATSVAEAYVPPVHEEYKPATWKPHKTLDDTPHDKQTGLGKVLKTIGMAAGATGIALLLSGCGASTGMTSGTVVDTAYEAAHTGSYTQCVTMKPVICRTISVERPDKWTITVEGQENGQTVTKVFKVEEPVFKDTQIGDSYILDVAQSAESAHEAEIANINSSVPAVVGTVGGLAATALGGWFAHDKIAELRYNRKR